jgi:hypothetical protein
MQFNPRQYERRSLHKEAVANRVIREFEMQSIYQGPSYAAVDVMHKYDATIDEMAWVLMGDTVTKSNEVYAYIESVIKARGGPLGRGAGPQGMTRASERQLNQTMADMPQYTPGSGMEGGPSQGTAGGNMQSHQAAGHLQSAQPGLGQRFKNWASQRALPAVGRGMQHLGAATMGGLAAGPLGAMAGLGGSMAASHARKKQGVDAYGNPLQQGEGLGQIAGDAAKAGVAGARNFAGQQAQNFQTGEGAMGGLGQAAGAVGNIGRGIASAVGNAWNQAGQTQQANLQQMDPNLARIRQREEAAKQAAQQQQVAPEQQQVAAQPEMAQVDPSALGQIAGQQGQQVPQWQQQPGAMTGAQTAQQNMIPDDIRTSNDTYSSIESILKGW